MKRIILIILLLLVTFLTAPAIKLGVLKDVLKPESICVWGDELYVVEGATIHCFSLTDLKPIKTFGKAGEGPGEMRILPFWPIQITLTQDCVFAENMDKFIFFSKQGNLINEQKKMKRLFKVLPVKENYAARTFPFEGNDKKQYEALKLLNKKMEDEKELFRQSVPVLDREGTVKMFPDSMNFCVYGDNIFVERSTEGFRIDVFDSQGNKLYEIKKPYEKTLVTEEYKKTAEASLKESLLHKKVGVFVPFHIMESGWDAFKKWALLDYPEYLPPIRDFLVKNDKIYVQTYVQQKGQEQYVILDLKGEILKTVNLPRIKNASVFVYNTLGIGLRFYDFEKDRFIYIEENEDLEEWEVYVVPVEI